MDDGQLTRSRTKAAKGSIPDDPGNDGTDDDFDLPNEQVSNDPSKKKRGRKPKNTDIIEYPEGKNLPKGKPPKAPKTPKFPSGGIGNQITEVAVPVAKVYVSKDITSAAASQTASIVHVKESYTPMVHEIHTQKVQENVAGDNSATVLKSYFSLKRIEQVEAHKTRLEMIGQEEIETHETEKLASSSQLASHKLDSLNQEHRRTEQV